MRANRSDRNRENTEIVLYIAIKNWRAGRNSLTDCSLAREPGDLGSHLRPTVLEGRPFSIGKDPDLLHFICVEERVEPDMQAIAFEGDV